ncbi:uroporphyrinogen-III synthase [Pseudomonas sp. HK3]
MNKSILITRPQGQADELINALTHANWHCVHQPLLRIAPFDEQHGAPFHAMKQHILDLDQYDVVISVSGNASSLAVDLIDQYWPQMPSGIDWYAVGPSSAHVFNMLGITMQVPLANHSEGLLELAGLNQDLNHKKVLIFRGVGGREHLADTLKQRGAKVHYCELYQREPVHFSHGELAALVQQEQIHYALLTSGEMLHQLATQLTDEQQQSVHVIVPSERIANMAPALHIQHVHICPKINAQGLLDCLSKITHSS